MAQRKCSYCNRPMPWWTKLVFFHTCKGCAVRMSMGGFPMPRVEDEDGTS